MSKQTKRNLLIAGGWGLGYVGSRMFPLDLAIGFIVLGIALTLWGCFLWTQIKNRHWGFTLWGLLSPIGLLGISLLKEKSMVKK